MNSTIDGEDNRTKGPPSPANMSITPSIISLFALPTSFEATTTPCCRLLTTLDLPLKHCTKDYKMPREGHSQAARRSIANGGSKKWKIARQTKTPRGFVNEENKCYRHAALQPLLHLYVTSTYELHVRHILTSYTNVKAPFRQWSLQHSKHGQKWSCQQDDPNRTLNSLDDLTQGILLDTSFETKTKARKDAYLKRPDGGTIRNEDLEDHDTNLYLGCVPCLLQRLIRDYWSNVLVDDYRDPFAPVAFPHSHHAIFALHRLTQRYFCRDPPGLSDAIAAHPPPVADRDRLIRVARRNNMTDQQDADEFQRFLVAGIETSWELL
jgi:hypothetical protein